MALSSEKLNNLFSKYKKWVSENPQLVSDVETTAKWVSYFIAGRLSNSTVTSELIYSLSNILVLFNDRIIEKANTVNWRSDGNGDRIKVFLTTLEYCEVFIELSAKSLWGQRGKWFIIVVVQVVKSIARYLLLKQYSEEIIRVPAIPQLNRKKLEEVAATQPTDDYYVSQSAFFFKLKRSGRVIRKIEGAPPLHLRTWKPLDTGTKRGVLNTPELSNAEILYIAKPLIHLGAIRVFGYKSWKSYSLALLCDLASIRIYYNNRHLLNKQQKLELSRRCVNLLLYLMRSPFYERATEKRLLSFLTSLGNNIPLLKMICNPLAQYIPQWQDTYFYMWPT
ncbi:unnamed protein product [Hermetia illucens]|uniref:Peroxisomal membrane protein PEX16 n=1 Tax=Hermetia illucens TaxID=343691 RepID=A0A7R8Z094_HERIL|nr:peroxisomal membrane protein PEX16 [Hermetia illucens]CAD7090783.1 unnamed protein product [Hermetia illucens]